ncbi:hypothetical protein LCGC14_2787740 [marine sediment metagenome]|uniref:Uncharacterized protein n=1 Tax=marine sediment metagenome TaxID=412755 RepID=A0A0F9B030_9ZZZZ
MTTKLQLCPTYRVKQLKKADKTVSRDKRWDTGMISLVIYRYVDSLIVRQLKSNNNNDHLNAFSALPNLVCDTIFM